MDILADTIMLQSYSDQSYMHAQLPPKKSVVEPVFSAEDRSEKAKLAYMEALGMTFFQSPAVLEDQHKQMEDLAAMFENRKARYYGEVAVAHQAGRPKTEEELIVDEAEKHDDTCARCGHGGELLMCDTCPLVFHLPCLEPPLYAVPEGTWLCPHCTVVEENREREMSGYACGSLGTMLKEFETKWFLLQKLTTSEIQTLEERHNCLSAQNEELKRNLKDAEDQAGSLQNQVHLLGKHQTQTTHALAQLQSTLQSMVLICRGETGSAF